MTAALVISRIFPANDQMVHGIVQRLQTQVEALARIADRIDCLFLTGANQQFTPEELRAHEERLRRRWSSKLHLSVAPVLRPKPVATRWQRYGPGIFDFHSQEVGADVDNDDTVHAGRAAQSAAPALIHAPRLSIRSLMMKLARDTRRVPVFFDLDDIEHSSFARRLLRHPSWPMERLLLLQMPRLLLTEIQAIRRSRLTFVCSEHDRRHLRRLARSGRIEVVANGIRFPTAVGARASAPVVLFVGYMGYPPNALAADALVRDIWPIVRARVPTARLLIAGSRPQRVPSYPSTDPSVTFTGFVDDLDALYQQARVVCCPISCGSGTRVKIIEAAAHARAIVSTALGAEGLAFEDGVEIILRDDVAALADECVRLLEDPAAAERLGTAARARARATYERSAVVEQLARLFADALPAPANSALGSARC
jgi:glycosyltransferase involved in cell wall biosynthesis